MKLDNFVTLHSLIFDIRHHSVTFGLNKDILLINIWNIYVSASESYTDEPMV